MRVVDAGDHLVHPRVADRDRNGIEPTATTEPGLAVGVAAAVAPVVPAALDAAAAGLLDDAADDVPAAEPHPASATAAAPARTARADVYLLMVMRTAQG